MKVSKILAFVFFSVSIGIAYYLFNSVRSEVVARKEIDKLEEKVIHKLKMIREAQVAYHSAYGFYAGDWELLVKFVGFDTIYLTTRRERVIPLEYGADSVLVNIDTIAAVAAQESIFPAERYPNFMPKQLPYVPHVADTKFNLFVDKINRSGVMVDVIEVKDPQPANPKRSDSHKNRSMRPLQFGSRANVSLAGNWE